MTDFLELPAEIRNAIYGWALTNAEPIAFQQMSPRSRELREAIGAKWRPVPRVKGVRVPQKELTWSLRPTRKFGLAGQLLRVSKAIQAETTPILYGRNHFLFNDFEGLHNFLIIIGSHQCYLRVLEVSMMRGLRHIHSAMILLKQAKSLETLRIGLYSCCLRADKFAKLLAPLLRAHRGAFTASGSERPAGLSIEGGTVAWERINDAFELNEPSIDKPLSNEVYVRQVRACLQQLLPPPKQTTACRTPKSRKQRGSQKLRATGKVTRKSS